MLYPTVLQCSTVFQPIVTVYVYIVKVSHDHVLLERIYNNLMHMWHHVTNHLITSNDKDSNSENRIKLRVRDNGADGFGVGDGDGDGVSGGSGDGVRDIEGLGGGSLK
jgi:hypothetical protein